MLKLIETLPQHKNYKRFLDNWFCSLGLCLELCQMGFLTIATIRSNRIKSCPLPCEKDLKKRERGANAYRTDLNSGMSVLRWYDNKCVQMWSNYSDPAPTSTIKRWDRKENKEIEISCTSLVAEYNAYMGRVDFSDMLISLYCTKFKTKHWYLKIMARCIDICKVNAWLIYRRYCSQ